MALLNKNFDIVNKFYETIEKIITWICDKFSMAEEDTLIRDFQNETNIFIEPEEQIKHEKEIEWDLNI